METIINQSLFIRLQILNLQPMEMGLHVHSYGAEGTIYISYRKIIYARFGEKRGYDALLSMLALQDSWISQTAGPCPEAGNMNSFIEEFLIETVRTDCSCKETCLIEPQKLETKFGRPVCWQGLVRHYEIHLTVVGGSSDGHTYPLAPGENLLGKVPECTVFLPDPTVSRKHCSILLTDTQIRVIDLGSSNGTYLNGIPVNDALLAPEDELSVGETLLKVHYSLRRPGARHEEGLEKIETAVETRKKQLDRFSLKDAKTINWKEFTPKKHQIISKIISSLKSVPLS
jgi:hypothetical protein